MSQRNCSKPVSYTHLAVKFSFWFMEFRKTVQLLSEGKSFADIKKSVSYTHLDVYKRQIEDGRPADGNGGRQRI